MRHRSPINSKKQNRLHCHSLQSPNQRLTSRRRHQKCPPIHRYHRLRYHHRRHRSFCHRHRINRQICIAALCRLPLHRPDITSVRRKPSNRNWPNVKRHWPTQAKRKVHELHVSVHTVTICIVGYYLSIHSYIFYIYIYRFFTYFQLKSQFVKSMKSFISTDTCGIISKFYRMHL